MQWLREVIGDLIDGIDRRFGFWHRRMRRQLGQYAQLIAENQDRRHALIEDIDAKQRQLLRAAKQFEATVGPKREALKDIVDELTRSIEIRREEREVIAENIDDLMKLSAKMQELLAEASSVSRTVVKDLEHEITRTQRRVRDRRDALRTLPERTIAEPTKRRDRVPSDELVDEGVAPRLQAPSELTQSQRDLIEGIEREMRDSERQTGLRE